jgi:hypothetical protein
MGWDYSVYVKARRRTRDKIRELAARMAKSFEGELVEADEDEEEDDDYFAGSTRSTRPSGTSS